MHNPMKLHLISALLGIGMSAASLAAEAFRVYAPAPKTQTLWIVDARPRSDRFRCAGRESKFLADVGLTNIQLPLQV